MSQEEFRYVGDGTEFLFGVPARDLTTADLATLDADQRANVKASRLYQSPPTPKQAEKVEDVKAAKHPAPAPAVDVKNGRDAG